MCFGGGNKSVENQPVAVVQAAPPPQPVTPITPQANTPPTNEATANAAKSQPGETGTKKMRGRGVYDNVARFGETYHRTNTMQASYGKGVKFGSAT